MSDVRVTRPLVVACVLSGIRSYLLVDPMLGARYSVVMLMGYVVDWNSMSMDPEVTVKYVVVIGLDIDHGVGRGRTVSPILID